MPAVSNAPAAYDLTAFTGRKKNAERVFYVRNYEMNLFTAYVVGASAFAGLPVAGLLYALLMGIIPAYAMIAFAAPVFTVIIGLTFVDQRSKQGLRLRKYRALIDKKTSQSEKETIYICGEPVASPQVSLFTPQFALATSAASSSSDADDGAEPRKASVPHA